MEFSFNNPDEYSQKLVSHHISKFLPLEVCFTFSFLDFLFDDERELHWIGKLEQKIAAFGKIRFLLYSFTSFSIIFILFFIEEDKKIDFILQGHGEF